MYIMRGAGIPVETEWGKTFIGISVASLDR